VDVKQSAFYLLTLHHQQFGVMFTEAVAFLARKNVRQRDCLPNDTAGMGTPINI